MIINESNGTIINTKNVYLHDDNLLLFGFERNEKKIQLKLEKYSSRIPYVITFRDVIGFEMSSCDFWGASECVLDFEYVEPCVRTIIPKLERKWGSVPCCLEKFKYNDYIEILFTFGSGDELRIASKTIEIDQAM